MRVWIETWSKYIVWQDAAVTLYVRVWIETFSRAWRLSLALVTLYVRVWIETRHRNPVRLSIRKSPST